MREPLPEGGGSSLFAVFAASWSALRRKQTLTQRMAQRPVMDRTQRRSRAVEGKRPPEDLPRIGTVRDPSLFFDEDELLLAYEIAPISGGGCAVVWFSGIIHFECNPLNVHGVGMGQETYPTEAWCFTEVLGSDRTEVWAALKPRFWTISFNDRTVEVLFERVELVQVNLSVSTPHEALLSYISSKPNQ